MNKANIIKLLEEKKLPLYYRFWSLFYGAQKVLCISDVDPIGNCAGKHILIGSSYRTIYNKLSKIDLSIESLKALPQRSI
jgi:hypothetical protein